MNQRQEDRLTMYYAVKTICGSFQSVWEENDVFKASYELWESKIEQITENRLKQNMIITGFTTEKSNKRETMTNLALFIISRLQSYANVSNDAVLSTSVKYSPRDLQRARDTDVVGICEIVLNHATNRATQILTYGVTAAMISGLQTAITDFTESLSMPVSAMAVVKSATETIARLFKEAADVLNNRLDLDMEMFRTSHPDFYSQYQTTRKIISTGNRAVSVMGNVTLAETGEAMKGVALSFVIQLSELMATHTPKPLVKKSGQKGNFWIASLPEGNYTVTVKKIGFKEQVLNVIVTDGETNKMKVKMEKL